MFLNADIGEGYDDRRLLRYVDAVNIACGGHTGDADSITTALQQVRDALDTGRPCAVGAHPSYPDRRGFGRTAQSLSDDALQTTLHEQLSLFARIARQLDIEVSHVKAHGALYHRIASDHHTAQLFARCCADVFPAAGIVTLAGSSTLGALGTLAPAVFREAFADRRYQSDGQLVPRTAANAVYEHSELALQQAIQLMSQRSVTSVDGQVITIDADTLCIHGDSDIALQLASDIAQAATIRRNTVPQDPEQP